MNNQTNKAIKVVKNQEYKEISGIREKLQQIQKYAKTIGLENYFISVDDGIVTHTICQSLRDQVAFNMMTRGLFRLIDLELQKQLPKEQRESFEKFMYEIASCINRFNEREAIRLSKNKPL